jgi:hypothetical protein
MKEIVRNTFLFKVIYYLINLNELHKINYCVQVDLVLEMQ